MKCDAMREWFSDRLDDSLDPDRSAQVDQHLAQCASCLAEFEALRLAIGRLRQAGPPATSADERAVIMAAIDREAEDRLVASAVGGESIERRSGVFKRAILMPRPEPAPRKAIALFTHVASFGIGIAAAALFWFVGARDTSSAADADRSTHESAQTRIEPTVVTSSTPNRPIEPPVVAPRVEPTPPPAPVDSPPQEMLLRVSGDLTVVRNGERGIGSSAPLTLKPGDVVEAQSAGRWRIIVGDHGALEVQSEPASPAPRTPTISRGPMIAIDLDPAPLQRLAARMRSSIEQLAGAVDRATERMPKTPIASEPTIASPKPAIAKQPAESTDVSSVTKPVVAGAPPSALAVRGPVVVRHDEAGLRLQTAGSPIEVVPALIQRLRDDDARVVALVVARLELVREEFERDPTFPRVAPRVASAPVSNSLFGLVTSLVASTPSVNQTEDTYAYWNRWFDTCADAIVARETYGTW
ncbi:MAG: zf-HC2 domain-containing protein [Planctomycetes bacterium]|nr:zf-HC2 domain-containing protein [Planctomycetota bacterium]